MSFEAKTYACNTGKGDEAPLSYRNSSASNAQSALESPSENLDHRTIPKRQQNQCCLIFRLPNEILCEIFLELVPPSIMGGRRRSYSILSVLYVSHVCHRWRCVALDCSCLWRDVPLDYPRWAKEMLVRSKTAPIRVAGILDEESFPDSTELLVKSCIENASRIAGLHLELGSGGVSLGQVILHTPLPALKSCRIISYYERNAPLVVALSSSTQLTNLSLFRCGLEDWPSLPSENLKVLEIFNLPWSLSLPSNIFISVLSNMKVLETLVLHGTTIFSDLYGLLHSREIAYLPRLKVLDIEGLAETSTFILNHISYSDTTQVCVDFKSHFNPVERATIRNFFQSFKVYNVPRALSLTSSLLYLSPHDSSCSENNTNGTMKIKYNPFRFDFSELVHTSWLQHLARLEITVQISKEDCIAFFGHLRNLQYIQVDSLYSEVFLDAMLASCDSCQEKHLYFLPLCRFTFSRYPSEKIMAQLKTCLETRKEMGLQLAHLSLDYAPIHSDDAAALKGLVTTLEYDESRFLW